jgi:hypothetical protein
MYPGLAAIWRSPGGSHPGAGSGDINGIPSYTLWWVQGLADYVRYTGDLTLIQAVRRELVATLAHLVSWVGEDGRWRFHGGWDFVDWSPIPSDERETFCHLLATQALREGINLLDRLSREEKRIATVYPRREWDELCASMISAARQAWCPDGRFDFGSSHHVNAMAIRSGILTPAEQAGLFAQALVSDPPARMTYWHRSLDLEAASQAGRIAWGLDSIRRHWGPQVELGAATLWEAFDPAWNGPDPHGVSVVGAERARDGGYETSQCHGWSAGPAIWLHTAILGIQPLEPGFTITHFAPHLGDLDWAEGVVPTPSGDIHVKLRKKDREKPVAEVKAPREIQIELAPWVGQEWNLLLS